MEKIGMTKPKLKKNRITQVFASFLVLALSVTLTGCAGINRKESKKIDTSKEQRYAYPLATASPEDTVTQIYAEKFAEEVEKLSDGRIKIQVYPNSVLGGDRELLESCYDGDVPFVAWLCGPGIPSNVHKPESSKFCRF